MPATLKNSSATLKLNTGASIPVLGFGTWRSVDNNGYHSVIAALKAGYRHIDAAAIYLNEEEVGRAIKDSGVLVRKFLLLLSFGVRNNVIRKLL